MKRHSKSIRVVITPERLVEAFMETLYFDKNVERVRISISRYGHEVPTQNVYITCVGKGRIKGKIKDNVLEGTIYGTDEEINEWLKFFGLKPERGKQTTLPFLGWKSFE